MLLGRSPHRQQCFRSSLPTRVAKIPANCCNTESLFHSTSFCGNPFGYSVVQRFHRANIDWNYSSKEEDWCRSLLSMSDGSSRAGYLGPTAYRPITDGYIHSVFDRYSFNRILFRESRHIMS